MLGPKNKSCLFSYAWAYAAISLHACTNLFACVSKSLCVCACASKCMRIFVYACLLQSIASAKKKKSRKAAFVTFVDYGSVDSIPLKQLLPLDQVRVIKLYGYLSSRCLEITAK